MAQLDLLVLQLLAQSHVISGKLYRVLWSLECFGAGRASALRSIHFSKSYDTSDILVLGGIGSFPKSVSHPHEYRPPLF